MKRLFYLLPILFLSCSQQTEELMENQQQHHLLKSYKIEVEEALKKAVGHMDSIFGDNFTTRSAPEISIVKSYKTRSVSTPDTLYYIINFSGEEGGFAMMGADRRLPELMAISDTGRLDINDTTFNKGLATFMSMALNPEIDPIVPPDTITTITRFVGKPLLKPQVRTWHQESPFNKYCPKKDDNSNYYVGCTPLAIAQIMSFFEWPRQYNDIHFNWSDIKYGKDNDGVAKLLALLGNEDNLNCEYSNDGTGTSSDNLSKGFTNFGYTFPKFCTYLYKDIPTDALISHSPTAHPILMCGITFLDGSWAGHSWVGDGYMEIHNKVDANTTLTNKYIHCVWDGEEQAMATSYIKAMEY